MVVGDVQLIEGGREGASWGGQLARVRLRCIDDSKLGETGLCQHVFSCSTAARARLEIILTKRASTK